MEAYGPVWPDGPLQFQKTPTIEVIANLKQARFKKSERVTRGTFQPGNIPGSFNSGAHLRTGSRSKNFQFTFRNWGSLKN